MQRTVVGKFKLLTKKCLVYATCYGYVEVCVSTSVTPMDLTLKACVFVCVRFKYGLPVDAPWRDKTVTNMIEQDSAHFVPLLATVKTISLSHSMSVSCPSLSLVSLYIYI